MAEDRSDQAATFLNRAPKTLDEWRHLPAYQLEHRVDIFFGLLLPEILEAEYGLPRNHLEVIPEFPLHKEIMLNDEDERRKGHKSIKVDFAVFHKGPDPKRIFLVELKTDNASINVKQLKRMEKAEKKSAKDLLQGVICCARHSESPRKYAHLIRRLARLRCIEKFKEFSREDWIRRQPGLAGRFGNMRVGTNWSDEKIEFVLVYPGGEPSTDSSKSKICRAESLNWLRTIGFCKVTNTLREHPLAPFLQGWANYEAGREYPWRTEG